MSKGTPYVVDIDALVSGRLLIYLELEGLSFLERQELQQSILTDYTANLVEQLQATAALPDNDYITYSVDIRPAGGHEVGGDDALDEGILRFDFCEHCAIDTDDEEEAA